MPRNDAPLLPAARSTPWPPPLAPPVHPLRERAPCATPPILRPAPSPTAFALRVLPPIWRTRREPASIQHRETWPKLRLHGDEGTSPRIPNIVPKRAATVSACHRVPLRPR